MSRWWFFQLYALVICVVPAALTVNDFPQLRLICFPILLNVLAIPSVVWLLATRQRRAVLFVLVGLLIVQGSIYQWSFHERPPERWYVFDARFPDRVLTPALDASRGGKIYLYDPTGHSGYIQALWYGVTRGVDAGRLIRVAPEAPRPPGAVVISTEEECTNCRLITRSINYIVYAAEPSDLSAHPPRLDPAAFDASIKTNTIASTFETGASRRAEFIVRNTGSETWPAVASIGGNDSVVLRGRWLPSGTDTAVGDAVATRIPYDMQPGDTAGLTVELTPPRMPGSYVLELKMVQESSACETSPLRLDVEIQKPL